VRVFAYRRFSPKCDTTHLPRKDIHGYLLYDGGCGFCSWWESRMRASLSRIGIATAPLQSDWVGKTLCVPIERTTEDIRLLLSDGTVMSGVDAYSYIMRRLPGLRVLGRIVGLPMIRGVAWRIYRFVNQNRHTISRACNLSPSGLHEHSSDSVTRPRQLQGSYGRPQDPDSSPERS